MLVGLLSAGQIDWVKHHYVPQFLLRRWANETGRLHVFSIRNGQIVSKARNPEYTGYEDGLYAIVAAAIGFSVDVLERRLFSPIDNGAAKALEKIEQRQVLTEDEHIAWSFFLSSLRVRQPDVIRFLRGAGLAHLKATLAEIDAETLPADAPRSEQWFNEHHPGRIESTTLMSWLPQMIFHDGIMDTFSGLKWWVREFQPPAPKLLLSDLPIHWEGGFNSDEFLIYLPIAPDRLFLGARSAETEAYLDHLPADELIRRVNRTTLASSADRIWASDEAEARSFIENNLDAIGENVMDFGSLAPWANAP